MKKWADPASHSPAYGGQVLCSRAWSGTQAESQPGTGYRTLPRVGVGTQLILACSWHWLLGTVRDLCLCSCPELSQGLCPFKRPCLDSFLCVCLLIGFWFVVTIRFIYNRPCLLWGLLLPGWAELGPGAAACGTGFRDWRWPVDGQLSLWC